MIPECPEYPDYGWINTQYMPTNEKTPNRAPLNNSSACFSSDEENKLKIKISRSDFEKIRAKLDKDWAKKEKLLKIRLNLGQSEAVISSVKQFNRTFFLGLFSVE